MGIRTSFGPSAFVPYSALESLLAYIIEAKDGVVNIDLGEKSLTLSQSLLPVLTTGSSYAIILYNATTGERFTFEEGSYPMF